MLQAVLRAVLRTVLRCMTARERRKDSGIPASRNGLSLRRVTLQYGCNTLYYDAVLRRVAIFPERPRQGIEPGAALVRHRNALLPDAAFEDAPLRRDEGNGIPEAGGPLPYQHPLEPVTADGPTGGYLEQEPVAL